MAALWDFMLPEEDQLPNPVRKLYLSSLLHGPPGKLLRKFAYGPLRYLWRQVDMPSDPSMMANRMIDYSTTTVEDQAIKDSHLKASRSDDAPIDFEMWAWPQESEPQTRARNLARLACHSFWRLNLTREALHWFFHGPDLLPSESDLNREAIIDCLRRASHSTFWDWADGSRLFFWRCGVTGGNLPVTGKSFSTRSHLLSGSVETCLHLLGTMRFYFVKRSRS
jgi:hypothetical protein